MSDEKVIEVDFKKDKVQHMDEGGCARIEAQRKEALSKLPGYRGEVTSKNQIRQLPDVEPGQIFWVSGDGKAYVVAEKDRKKMTIKALDENATVSTGITLYDMNVGIISKEPMFDFTNEEEVGKLKQRLWEWFNEDTTDKYYLLYGRNIHYLTLFNVGERKEGGSSELVQKCELDVIMDCVENIGGLISMDFNTTEGQLAIEIWIRTPDSPAELLYLFPYDKGLVTI